jgi:membrane-associated phospholipid phosphatase
MVFKRAVVTRTGWALGQAALIGLILDVLFKTVTGRPHPPYHLEFVRSNPSHVFHFGLLPGWDYSPYHVTEADISQVFHFGFLRGGIVYGWPSGHTIIAFGMSVALFLLFPKKGWIGAAALLYAFYIGIGVSMTIHWFSDFVSGAILGTIVGTTVGRSFAAMDFPSRGNGIQNVTQVTSNGNI